MGGEWGREKEGKINDALRATEKHMGVTLSLVTSLAKPLTFELAHT